MWCDELESAGIVVQNASLLISNSFNLLKSKKSNLEILIPFLTEAQAINQIENYSLLRVNRYDKNKNFREKNKSEDQSKKHQLFM